MEKLNHNKINFAVIGCGHIGKRHAEMIIQNKDASLVARCDIKPESELNLSPNEAPFFSSLAAVINSNLSIDVVNICTPNGLHAEQAIMALEAGLHVVIEKPMALNVADCNAIIAVAAKQQKHVFCVMQNRFSPPSIWLKSLIDGNILGDIYMVQINCFWNRDERYYHPNTWHGKSDLDGGTLFTQFSHFVDTLLWLFGPIENISGKFADFNHQHLTHFEDSGVVQFNFIQGGLGSINYSSSVFDKNMESSIKIIAQKGSVEVGGQYMNEVKFCHIQDYTMPQLQKTAAPNNYGPYTGSAANHHFIIENIIEVLHNNAAIATTATEGKLVVETISNIYALRPNTLLNKR